MRHRRIRIGRHGSDHIVTPEWFYPGSRGGVLLFCANTRFVTSACGRERVRVKKKRRTDRPFLSRGLVELLKGDALCGEDGGEDVPSIGGDRVAVGGVDFTDETVSAEQTELAGNAGGPAFGLVRGIGGRIEEKGLQVAVTESVDGELTMTDSFKEGGVFVGPGAQGANTLVVPGGGLTETTHHLAQRDRGVHGGEGIDITLVGSLGDLGTAVDIGDAFAQGEPVLGSGGLVFGVAKHFKGRGVVDGGFDAEDGALLVVEFNGVLSETMFDANAFGAVFEVGDDFALIRAMNLATEEAHDVRTGEGGHAV